MVFTILKTEFVKADPIQINYRDYSNFNSIHFHDELRKELSVNPSINNDCDFFQNTLRGIKQACSCKREGLTCE